MKRRLLVITTITLIAVILIAVCYYKKNNYSKEDCISAVVTYLEAQKTVIGDDVTIPSEIDQESGRVIRIYADSDYFIDRVIAYCENATDAKRVNDIPRLEYPYVYVGDALFGNNKKIYYSEFGKIYELTLSEKDSLAFLLYLTGSGSLYPETREFFTKSAILQLKNEIVYGNEDIIETNNGYLESIDIKTHDTAELLFECIKNCVKIVDLTDTNIEPMALPIEINGQAVGTFDALYMTCKETGQLICICFSQEDSKRFYEYVMALTMLSQQD